MLCREPIHWPTRKASSGLDMPSMLLALFISFRDRTSAGSLTALPHLRCRGRRRCCGPSKSWSSRECASFPPAGWRVMRAPEFDPELENLTEDSVCRRRTVVDFADVDLSTLSPMAYTVHQAIKPTYRGAAPRSRARAKRLRHGACRNPWRRSWRSTKPATDELPFRLMGAYRGRISWTKMPLTL